MVKATGISASILDQMEEEAVLNAANATYTDVKMTKL
jgi:hypothetical protein